MDKPATLHIRTRFKKLHPDARKPTYGTPHSAGMDLYALEDKVISRTSTKVRTGIAMEIPEGHYGKIFGRSGLAGRNSVVECAGVIDSDYRGEIIIMLMNFGDEDYLVEAGDRIAQMIIMPYVNTALIEVEHLKDTARGEGGFGHTGK